jgi:hypothetical protein
MLLIYWFKNYSVYFFASRYFITAHFLMDDFAEKCFDLNTALPKSFIKKCASPPQALQGAYY